MAKPSQRWRVLRRLLMGLLGLVLVAGGGLVAVLYGSLPDHDGTASINGLTAPVTVDRDAWGVPYIRAATEVDGYAALGFLHAQDRLWQMEVRRRIGAGRLAEVIGEPGLGIDRFMRLMRFHDLAAADLEAMTAEGRALVAAYTRGVNAVLASTWLLPPEFWLLWHKPEPWTDTDSVVWTKLMALDLAGHWETDLLRARLARVVTAEQLAELFPEYPPVSTARLEELRQAFALVDLDGLAERVPEPAPGLNGSNAWAVAGTRTADEAPLLANDPHLSLELPSVWYLAGLETPDFSFVGATLPGLPAFVIGRTERHAWGITNTGSDVQDLVIERWADAAQSATMGPAGPDPLDVRESTIGCAGCDDVTFASRWSRNGPLLSDLVGTAEEVAAGGALALRWTTLRAPDRTLEAGFALPKAQDLASFRRALERFDNPPVNVVYADRDGRIAMVSPGLVPQRSGHRGDLPVRGWAAADEWGPVLAASDVPEVVDPASGQVVNANENPVGPAFPYDLGVDWAPPFRAERIHEVLVEDVPITGETMRHLQLDTQSGVARDLLPPMLRADTETPRARKWLKRLADWDGDATPATREPTVFHAWYRALGRHLYADELGALFPAYRGLNAGFVQRALRDRTTWCDDVTTSRVEACPLVLGRALDEAVAGLHERLGEEGPDWDWGAQHQTALDHGLWSRLGLPPAWFGERLPIGGDGTAVNANAVSHAENPPFFPSRHGPGYRQIVTLGALEMSRFIILGGQVGHPWSQHYRDLSALWAAGDMIAMRRPDSPSSRLSLQP